MRTDGSIPDPFRTEPIRARVLRAWADAPARLREDANAEEDLALGGYRDRVVVELAQNAADAAVRAGVPGRLALTLTADALVASNVGSALDAAGVEALATLRASAKRAGRSGGGRRGTGAAQDAAAATTAAATTAAQVAAPDAVTADATAATVGRFGVGFAAVLALTDAPSVRSRHGGVRFDRPATRAAAQALPALTEELAHRGGHVPALRLPWPEPTPPEDGWDTTVVLPLRDDEARTRARRLLDETGPALLLALPGLDELTIDTRDEAAGGRRRRLTARRLDGEVVVEEQVTGADGTADETRSRWLVERRAGRLTPAQLADRPTEERAHPTYDVLWALPVDPDGAPTPLPPDVPPVLHAPTPTDERWSLPALLVARFPLDPSRRHVAPGAATDAVAEAAAVAYLELFRRVPSPALVPVGLAAGVLDGAVRAAVASRLPDAPVLPGRLRPRDAVVLDGGDDALLAVLADVLPAALGGRWSRSRAACEVAGIRRLSAADLVDALAGLDRPPAWWRTLYGVLGALPTGELGALPVPLADGRTVRGPRGLLVPTAALPPAVGSGALPVRLVHPDAAHPLLLRLGAVEADAAAVLDDPAVRVAVEAVADEGDPREVRELAEAVLALVAAAGATVGGHPWLAGLLLLDADGEPAEPAELALPGAPLLAVAEPDAYGLVDPELRAAAGDEALQAVGVRWSFPLVQVRDWSPGVDELPDLDDAEGWADALLAAAAADSGSAAVRGPGRSGDDRGLGDEALPVVVHEHDAVADLDLVAGDAWPAALELLAADPATRRAVVDPVRLDGGARVVHGPSYAGWWLARHARIAEVPLAAHVLPGDERLAGLFPTLPPIAVDPELLRAAGVRADLDAVVADPDSAAELLARLVDADDVPAHRLSVLYAALAAAAPRDLRLPAELRAVRGSATVVAAADDVVVVDRPDLLPVVAGTPHLRVPLPLAAGLADLLDLDLASERVRVDVPGDGVRRPVPDVASALCPDAPASWVEHDGLQLAAPGGDPVDVDWVVVRGEPHACTLAGLARALAWSAGRWELRHAVAEALADPAALPELLAERDLDA